MSRKKKLILGIATVLIGIYAIAAINTAQNSSTVATERVSAEKVQTPEPRKLSVQKLLDATNAERAKVGVKPLILDERLNASAQMKLEDLKRDGWQENSHVSSTGKQGYEYITDLWKECHPTENLNHVSGFNAFVTEDMIISSLMTSESHREAILDPRSDYIGFATSGTYTVQHFCDIDK